MLKRIGVHSLLVGMSSAFCGSAGTCPSGAVFVITTDAKEIDTIPPSSVMGIDCAKGL
ncbi:hypothetical protein [Candidatus Accumulibacter sp. ACC007]|uniref:hypothetical protein n=1 Tax=Candidatus Accumulibacter sp. ACC007 TaxID=2823333 RepID=UPI0025C4983A|nr:hypothetical protein [Candidatus Accumulibacter sp. ACC007]